MVRIYNTNDLEELKRIHSAHFANEFFEPDFRKYHASFVVDDDNTGEIVTMGGVRSILEMVVVTDKSLNPVTRMKSLYQILDASIYATKRMGFDQIYAWSQNTKWTKRMKKMGFRPAVGDSLIFDL